MTGFGTTVFMSEVAGGRAPPIFEFLDRTPQHLSQKYAFGNAINVQICEDGHGLAQDRG